MKGYFRIYLYLFLSLAISIFSFAGIAPLVGLFVNQMVLSVALGSGYVFLTLLAIIYSYLLLIK